MTRFARGSLRAPLLAPVALLLLAAPALAAPDAAGLVAALKGCETISSRTCMETAAALTRTGPAGAQQVQAAWSELPRPARFLAADALGRIGGPEALRAIASLLAGPGAGSVELAEALASLPGSDVEPHLIALLHDASEAVRAVAADALGHRDVGPKAREALLGAAADSQPVVRAAALRSLGVLGEPRAEALCTGALRGEDPALRLAAATALRHTGTTASVPALIDALVDPDDRVQAAALATLQGLTHEPFGLDELLWRSWWEVDHPR